MGRPWVLAVDLDGTFLEGKPADRHALYSALRIDQDVILIFCTGRSLQSVLPIIHDPTLPQPHFIIADVGGTVVQGSTLSPIEPLQSEITSRWPGYAKVLQAFASYRELIPQTVPQENRCSFFASAADQQVQTLAHSLGCEALFSGGRYLDILPAGVSKGSSLSRLIDVYQWNLDDVVVAGDSLNDLSLYQLGSAGVLVANAEPALHAAVLSNPLVHVAHASGASGLLEGLHRLGRVPATTTATHVGGSSLVMIYHRAPVELDPSGEAAAPRYPNGILPTLAGLADQGWDAVWICAVPASVRQPRQFNTMRLAGVPLTEEENEAFYYRFCKEALWPVLMSLPDQMRFDVAGWHLYQRINERFAQRAAEEAARGATIWIHDYNLWLVPGLLKRLRPDVRVIFFHHTPFPPTEIFRALPVAAQLLGSLLHCDLVGFQVPRYVVNFADAVCSTGAVTAVQQQACGSPRFATHGVSLGVPQMPSLIEVDGRTIRMGAYPVGIDVRRIEFQVQAAELRPEWQVPAGVQRVLSLERLDYSKAPVERLEAFELFLAQSQRHDQVEHVFACSTPAAAVRAYDDVWRAVCATVQRINQRFGSVSFQPVKLFKGPFPLADVVALYLTANVMWITAKRDGLNLVAKEFVAAQFAAGGDGALVLSSFTGVSLQLRTALLTNPYDMREMAATLGRALRMSSAERRCRLRTMAEVVAETDVERWAADMLGTVPAPDKRAPRLDTAIVLTRAALDRISSELPVIDLAEGAYGAQVS